MKGRLFTKQIRMSSPLHANPAHLGASYRIHRAAILSAVNNDPAGAGMVRANTQDSTAENHGGIKRM